MLDLVGRGPYQPSESEPIRDLRGITQSVVPTRRLDPENPSRSRGSRGTSYSGLLLVREWDERLGLSALIAANILDGRRDKNTLLPLPDLLRQSIYSRLAGYEDLNDAERLSHDPTFRFMGSRVAGYRGIFGGAGADRLPIRCTSDENLFTVS
jgi:Transposase DDE domain group 1